MRHVRRFRIFWLAGVIVAAVLYQAAPSAAISPQTLSDPTGDNCRDYQMIGNHCGPDITQAVFSTPGDGNLHADISYAALPLDGLLQQTVEFVEVGMFPKSATGPDLNSGAGTYLVLKSPLGWVLEKTTGGFGVVAQVTATTRALGIDLAIPLATIGDPVSYRYAVNAGSTGETMPEHPDLAPNTGLFDVVGDAVTPTPPAPTPTPTPIQAPPPGATPIRLSLSKIPTVQRGNAVSGLLTTTAPGDLTIEALVPAARLAAKSKLRSIGRITKHGVKAGKVSFRLPLKSSARRKLAGRKTRITLRITLKPTSGTTISQIRKVSLTVPR